MKVRFRTLVTDFVPCKNGSSQEEEKYKVFMYCPIQRSAQDRTSCRPAALSCPVLQDEGRKQDKTKNLVLCSPLIYIWLQHYISPIHAIVRHYSVMYYNR